MAQHRPPDSPAFIFKTICQVRLGGSTSTRVRRHRAGRNDARDAPSLNVWFRIAEREDAEGHYARDFPKIQATSFSSTTRHSARVSRPLPVCLVVGLGFEGPYVLISLNVWFRMVERPAQRGKCSAECSEYKNGHIYNKLKHL